MSSRSQVPSNKYCNTINIILLQTRSNQHLEGGRNKEKRTGVFCNCSASPVVTRELWFVVYVENLGVTLGRFLLLHGVNVVAGDNHETALNQSGWF